MSAPCVPILLLCGPLSPGPNVPRAGPDGPDRPGRPHPVAPSPPSPWGLYGVFESYAIGLALLGATAATALVFSGTGVRRAVSRHALATQSR
ncbi:hypothetical protein ACIGW3_03280 [Streptomyces sp. NPDC053499]|uniref:hypothetical protein n=1 Tax=Streptomyces sp. NPDC053499 TaxID=3365707 RepID=UPI0037D62281